jgi:hypothetical protein
MSKPLSNFTAERIRKENANKFADGSVMFVTRPYFSTRALSFIVQSAPDLNGVGVGVCVALAGQEMVFFDYHAGSVIQYGTFNQAFRATEAETNLVTDRQTNGSEDFAIDGIGVGQRGVRVRYSESDLATLWGTMAASPDTSFGRAMRGLESIYDPAGICVPPQFQSPFNLEDGPFTAAQGLVDVSIEWDTRRKVSIGTLDLFPQGGARSLLRANGIPASGNRYRIPEGFKWGRSGGQDSQLVVRAVLRHDLVIPLNLIVPPLSPSGAVQTPQEIDLEIVVRLYGMGFSEASANV